MSSVVLDQLHIKTFEKMIGRKLGHIELEQLRVGEPVFSKDLTGTWQSLRVRLYRFPHDLMPIPVDVANMEFDIGNSNFFEFYFGNSGSEPGDG